MTLTETDLTDLVAFRRERHRLPEVSGAEERTADAVVAFLEPTRPDEVITGLGGHGVAAVYRGADPGPTLLLRAELDALPIQEVTDVAYASAVAGVGHHCGHDGHMTMLAGVGIHLGRRRPLRGRVVLLFQPAEENGEGAAAVLADPAFAPLRPDMSLSVHNLSWLPFGHAELREGPVNCASRGLRIQLHGKTSHASAPEDGCSPMSAVAQLMPALTALGDGEVIDGALSADFRLVTVTHAEIGERAFGVAPGEAEVWATLRTVTDDRMQQLCAAAEQLARSVAEREGLAVQMGYHDVFHHSANHPAAVAVLRSALTAEAVPTSDGQTQRGSEDFGLFGTVGPSAMYFLGSGRGPDSPHMHNPDFDFPDELIGIGIGVFVRAVRDQLG